MHELLRKAILTVLFLGVLLPLTGCQTARRPADTERFTALWVTRWDFRTEEDARRAIMNAAEHGFTDVFWQVRGKADAFYPSRLEPWGEEITRTFPDGVPDTFDPLRAAVEEGRRRSVRVHAWVNVMPLWRGTTPPADRSHPWHTRPEWRLYDREGNFQPLNNHYVIANPVLDSVHDHIVDVCRDLVRRYDIAGVHLDYVRFVADTMADQTVYPSDPVSMRLFELATGRTEFGSQADLDARSEWIAGRITDLVRRIRRETQRARPGVELTAAVWRLPELGRERYMQEGVRWLNDGLVDKVTPMIYTPDDERFRSDLQSWRRQSGRDASRVVAGLGVYMHENPQRTISQMEFAGEGRRHALFAYASLFESPNPGQERTEEAKRLREQMREAVRRIHAQRTGRPAGRV